MSSTANPSGAGSPGRTHPVVVYSDDPAVRGSVTTAVGRRPAGDLRRVEWLECDTADAVLKAVDKGGVDLLVLDGEAWPAGGLGLAKQLKDEIEDCPPTIVLVARRDDAWLGKWSLADAILPFPADPADLTAAVAEQLRARDRGLPVRRVGS